MRNVHNLLFYGVVGKSVCRMWESCTIAFPLLAGVWQEQAGAATIMMGLFDEASLPYIEVLFAAIFPWSAAKILVKQF